MNADERLASAFAHALHGRVCTEVQPFRWGTAYLDERFRRRFDSNLLWVEGAPGDLTPGGLVEEADRVLGERGYRHRQVAIDEAQIADRVRPELLERGWKEDVAELMVLAGEPDRQRDLSAARSVPFPEARPLLVELTRREPWASDDEVVRQLVDHGAELERAAGARTIVVDVDGSPSAYCQLFVVGGQAQIEDVMTLEEHRGRGAASAAVLTAAAIARSEGATWIHLYADADDWPRTWYRRLGFVPAGSQWSFLRWPSEDSH